MKKEANYRLAEVSVLDAAVLFPVPDIPSTGHNFLIPMLLSKLQKTVLKLSCLSAMQI
jgi:hypothetical protein